MVDEDMKLLVAFRLAQTISNLMDKEMTNVMFKDIAKGLPVLIGENMDDFSLNSPNAHIIEFHSLIAIGADYEKLREKFLAMPLIATTYVLDAAKEAGVVLNEPDYNPRYVN